MIMDNNWKYKIELSNDRVFDELSERYHVRFPDDLRSFIVDNNAAYPEKKLINIDHNERVFESVLSFNEKEDDAASVFSIIDHTFIKTAIPFGLDPFGNVFYYSLVSSKILFWEHEEDRFDHSEYTLQEFIDNLH